MLLYLRILVVYLSIPGTVTLVNHLGDFELELELEKISDFRFCGASVLSFYNPQRTPATS